MGSLKSSADSSLERLKALDSIPRLEAQLDEVKTLCTHRVRADMIIKWILERLKNNSEARANAQTWRTLTLTLRLLSPERVGTYLASFDLFGTIQNALAETGTTGLDVLEVSLDLLDFLLELSSATEGASVKAALSLPANNAAAFLGIWFTIIVNLHGSGEFDLGRSKSFVQTPIRIWNLRKHSRDENTSFADECLVPVSMVLSIFSKTMALDLATNQTVHISSKKRQHGKSSDSRNSEVSLLELQLARHIFLPARNSFVHTRAQSKGADKHQGPPQQLDYSIGRMLKPMKSAVESLDHDESAALVACIPSLLGIALRCVSMETPKQIATERPWVERVWQEFYQMISPIHPEVARGPLMEMLSIVRERGPLLPQEALRSVIDKFSGLAEPEGGIVDWSLLARIVASDASIFANQESADTLFTAITTASTGDKRSATEDTQSVAQRRTLWTDSIVIPIMTAFARARKLPAFIGLWEKQLTMDEHNDHWSVWCDISAKFSPLVEDSLADEQALQLFTHYSNTFESACAGNGTIAQQPQLNASIVILHALIPGIKNEAIVDRLLPQLERFITLPQSKASQETSPFNEERYWTLASKVFSLWFPLSASRQPDMDIVSKLGESILLSSALAMAFTVAKRKSKADKQVDKAVVQKSPESGSEEVGRNAAGFVLGVCDHLIGFQQLRETCVAKLDELALQQRVPHMQAWLCYPELISNLSEKALRGLLKSLIRHTGEDTSAGAVLSSLASSATAHGRTMVIEVMLEMFLETLKTDSQNDQSTASSDIIKILIQFPPTSLTRPQREKLLNTLTSVPQRSAEQSAEFENQRRLALMVRLMQYSNPTCTLSTDPTAIREVASQVARISDSKDDGANLERGSATLVLLKELARRIISHLVATQDQQRSRDMLVALSEQVVKDIGKPSKPKFGPRESLTPFTLSMTILEELENGCKPALRDMLAHRNVKWAKKLVDFLLDKAHEALPQLLSARGDKANEETETVTHILEFLLDLPISYLEFGGLHRQKAVEPFVSFLGSMLLSEGESLLRPTGIPSAALSATRLAVVRSYCMICKFAGQRADFEVLALAEDLLQLELEPLAHEQVRKAFDQCVDHRGHDSWLALVHRFLAKDEKLTRSGLLLLPVCVKKLGREAWEASPDSQAGKMLHILLDNARITSDLCIFTRSLQCIDTILKEKPFLANQHAIETILINLPRLARHDANPAIAYALSTQIFTTLFLTHRARLQGRYHLVTRALQQLLSQLFTSTDFSTSRATPQTNPLTAVHAQAFSRLLALLCDPPQQRRQQLSEDGLALVDVARREQAHAGQLVPVVLHQYCVQVLHGTLAGEGMREALRPGLWAVVEAMEVFEAVGVKVLSSEMGVSERAVLRGVYEEWRRFGKWRGG